MNYKRGTISITEITVQNVSDLYIISAMVTLTIPPYEQQMHNGLNPFASK